MVDSNETIIYESGKDSGYESGYDDCKGQMKEIIEAMAYEIAAYRYPKQFYIPWRTNFKKHAKSLDFP